LGVSRKTGYDLEETLRRERAMSFPGTGKIWMNGKLVDWNNATIHVASHVVHYGSAVFEGARCYDTKQGPACFRLDAHMRRLYDSARIYRMEIPYDVQTLTDAVIDLIRVNNFRACYIRRSSIAVTTRSASTHIRARSTCRSCSGSGARISRRTRSRKAST
jgi:branched-subunit amino acid aminotransferase/4-amino-4-deoxychorismate lyase